MAKFYKVGGYVRDRLLGRTPKDIDYVVVGSTPEEMLANGFQQVGADFPVFLKDGCEYALARQERKTGHGYHGFETTHDTSVTLKDDLIRRDLTINAMAMDEDGNIIDPYNGYADLSAGILRHTSEAFAEDPLRVLRVARFAARYKGFTIATETLALMAHIVEDEQLRYLSKERFWSEFEKAFSEANPSIFLHTLHLVGALEKISPPLAFVLDQPVWDGLDKELDRTEGVKERFALLTWIYSDWLEMQRVATDMKVPNEVRDFAHRFAMYSGTALWWSFFECDDTTKEDEDVEILLRFFKVDHSTDHIIEAANLYRSVETMHCDVVKVEWFDKFITQAIEAFRAVTFETLPNREALKGKEIGEAIRNTRVAAITEITTAIKAEMNSVMTAQR